MEKDDWSSAGREFLTDSTPYSSYTQMLTASPVLVLLAITADLAVTAPYSLR